MRSILTRQNKTSKHQARTTADYGTKGLIRPTKTIAKLKAALSNVHEAETTYLAAQHPSLIESPAKVQPSLLKRMGQFCREICPCFRRNASDAAVHSTSSQTIPRLN